jgi:hypothetical protein
MKSVPLLYFVAIFADRIDRENDSDLVIGNESDCGYVVRAPIYEILTLACSVHRFLCCIMR